MLSILSRHIWLINNGDSVVTCIHATCMFNIQPCLKHAKSPWCQFIWQKVYVTQKGNSGQHDKMLKVIMQHTLSSCYHSFAAAVGLRYNDVCDFTTTKGAAVLNFTTRTHAHTRKRTTPFGQSSHENVELNIADPVLAASSFCVAAGNWGNDE